jgi:hypothetical protein
MQSPRLLSDLRRQLAIPVKKTARRVIVEANVNRHAPQSLLAICEALLAPLFSRTGNSELQSRLMTSRFTSTFEVEKYPLCSFLVARSLVAIDREHVIFFVLPLNVVHTLHLSALSAVPPSFHIRKSQLAASWGFSPPQRVEGRKLFA